jgi:hypothetical protein
MKCDGGKQEEEKKDGEARKKEMPEARENLSKGS